MAQAETNRVDVRFAREATYGVPNPTSGIFQRVRYTGGQPVSHEKQTIQSQIIRSDRNVADLIEVAASAAGTLNYELLYGVELDTLIEGALFSDFTGTLTGSIGDDIDVTGINVTVAVPGDATLTRSAGDFLTDGVVADCWIRYTDATNGTVYVRVKAATSTVLTCDATALSTAGAEVTLQAHTGTGSEDYRARFARNGTADQSFTVEMELQDLVAANRFFAGLGMRIANWSMNLQAQQIVTGSINLVGREGQVGTSTVATGAIQAPGATSSMNATANVGRIFKDDAALVAKLRSLNFTVENNLRPLPIVGDRFPVDVNAGIAAITGQVEAYVPDLSLLSDLISHATASIGFAFVDADGNLTAVYIDRLKFATGGQPDVPGINQDVIQTIGFQAIVDAGSAYTIHVDRIPVS